MAHPLTQDSPQTRARSACLALVAGTPVLTLRGSVMAQDLRPADRLVTRSGAVPLTGIAAQTTLRHDLVRVSARALGHDRPEGDVLLPADQPILLRDWRALALFGAPQAAVPLHRLVDGTHIRPEPARMACLIHLTLARPAVLYAGGLELPTPG